MERHLVGTDQSWRTGLWSPYAWNVGAPITATADEDGDSENGTTEIHSRSSRASTSYSASLAEEVTRGMVGLHVVYCELSVGRWRYRSPGYCGQIELRTFPETRVSPLIWPV